MNAQKQLQLAKQAFKTWQQAKMLYQMSDAFQQSVLDDDFDFDSIDATSFIPAGSVKADTTQYYRSTYLTTIRR